MSAPGKPSVMDVGRAHAGEAIRRYVANLDVRAVTIDGELLREPELDPSRCYQWLDREIE